MITLILSLIALFLIFTFVYYCLGGFLGVFIVILGVILCMSFNKDSEPTETKYDMTDKDISDCYKADKIKDITFKK